MQQYKQKLNLLLLFFWAIPSITLAQILFLEKSEEKNVQHRIEHGSIGAGVSVYDFNQDGLDDLSLGSEKGAQIAFFINTGNTLEAIPPLVNNLEEVKQILWADYDNDGDKDLFVSAYWGQDRLYRNEGELQMTDITEAAGIKQAMHGSYGAVWGDYNRDGWLDLLCNYRSFEGDITGGNSLYKNNADGTFTEVTDMAKMDNLDKLPFASAFIDYNNDQWPDIYTANDKLSYNTLYENRANGQFLDVSKATGSDARMNGMCVNAADVNQDGWVDIYITNTPVGGYFLQNNGQQNDRNDITFENLAVDKGIAYLGGNGWGSNFFDADNDGDLDLYICGKSNNPIAHGVHFHENHDNDYFEIITEGFEIDTFASFVNAIADFDLDGNLDIMVQNNPPGKFHLWENHSPNTNNWVKIKLEGVLSNRDAIGAKVEVHTKDLLQTKYTYCGFAFLGQNSGNQHVGLHQQEQIDSLIITWPTGHIDRFYELAVNQIYPIREGETTGGDISVAEDVTLIDRPNLSTSTVFLPPTIQLTLAPNPVADILHIQSNTQLSALEILSVAGKQIQQIVSPNNTQFSIHVGSLTAGLYLLKIQTAKGDYFTRKWVKK